MPAQAQFLCTSDAGDKFFYHSGNHTVSKWNGKTIHTFTLPPCSQKVTKASAAFFEGNIYVGIQEGSSLSTHKIGKDNTVQKLKEYSDIRFSSVFATYANDSLKGPFLAYSTDNKLHLHPFVMDQGISVSLTSPLLSICQGRDGGVYFLHSTQGDGIYAYFPFSQPAPSQQQSFSCAAKKVESLFALGVTQVRCIALTQEGKIFIGQEDLSNSTFSNKGELAGTYSSIAGVKSELSSSGYLSKHTFFASTDDTLFFYSISDEGNPEQTSQATPCSEGEKIVDIRMTSKPNDATLSLVVTSENTEKESRFYQVTYSPDGNQWSSNRINL